MTEKEESARLARILAQFVATMDNLDAVQEGLTRLGYNTAELRTAKERLIVFLHALKMSVRKKRTNKENKKTVGRVLTLVHFGEEQ